MVKDQPFEIPQQFRQLAEQNVEQASAAYGQFMDAMAQAMSMWWSALPPNEMTVGLKAVQDRSVRFAKENADAAFALASSLAMGALAEFERSLISERNKAGLAAARNRGAMLGRPYKLSSGHSRRPNT